MKKHGLNKYCGKGHLIHVAGNDILAKVFVRNNKCISFLSLPVLSFIRDFEVNVLRKYLCTKIAR